MKFEVLVAYPISVTMRNGDTRVFPDKESLINHLTNKMKGIENCIAHYEKELARLRAELIPVQEDLASSEAMTLPGGKE